MKIRIEHIPLYGCLDEVEEMRVPDKIINDYDLQIGKIIDLEKFKIKISEINESTVKLIIFDNHDVMDIERIVDYENYESILILELNKSHNIYLPVFDAMEDWTLTLINE